MAKILILANKDVGLYKFRKELIEELTKENEVYVSLPNGEFVLQLKELGCKFIDTPMSRRGVNPVQDFKLFKHYREIIREIKPDVVLSYTIKPNVYGGLACRISNTPYIANITGLGTSIENTGAIQKISLILYKIGLKKAECVFFQNESNQMFFLNKKLVKGRTRLIPGSGVNIQEHSCEPYPPNEGTIKILFVGRLMKAKGIDELLDVALAIREKNLNVEFDLLGVSEPDKEKKVNDFNKKGIIRYQGFQSNIHTFLKKSHAIVLPSHHEGLANVLLESASVGRPILASNIPGCIETFEEGVSGFSFEVRNAESLMRTIMKFVNLPYSQKQEMGTSAREKIEKEFNRKIIVDAYLEEIYRALEEN